MVSASLTCHSSIDLATNQRDGLLIDGSGVPGLDRPEIGLAGLIAGARAPAMGSEEIGRRGERVGGDVEIAAGAVVQDALGQELGLADLAVHGAPRAG